MSQHKGKIGRRDLFKTSAGIMGGALLSREAAAEQPAQRNVNTNSSPSALKITDLRVAVVAKPGPSPCPIVRIDTNQGVYGLGEVRDGASPTYALFLKSRLLNENPLNITFLFQKIKQFGFHGRQAGGVVAVEEALWDIAGKVYNVPIYQMLGGKFRDRVRIYADTDESDDPQDLRAAPEGAQGRDGPHLAEDGRGHRPGAADPRHGDRGPRSRPPGSAEHCRIPSSPPRSPKRASRSSPNMCRPRARPSAWRFRFPWTTSATWA